VYSPLAASEAGTMREAMSGRGLLDIAIACHIIILTTIDPKGAHMGSTNQSHSPLHTGRPNGTPYDAV
jgi:hypothetical protein